ncbi:MAG TPA: flavin reductase family protein [Acidimicrobiales bacterium]|jgi:flavin reductase (DIM6/NTAB) family NADH-FMN oxidoreductase RutF|nr:flavin reductase family protein [Acidimicrobiales bacterium]
MTLSATEADLVTPELMRAVMGHFPTGVTIVTAVEDGLPVGFTCQSFFSLSLDPPLIALAPAKTSTSWPKIAKAGTFCVNILSTDQRGLCETFAASGGDKFVGVRWTPTRGGSPRIEGCLAWIECDLELTHDAGDHELVLGRVRSLGHREGSPLLYFRSGFMTTNR